MLTVSVNGVPTSTFAALAVIVEATLGDGRTMVEVPNVTVSSAATCREASASAQRPAGREQRKDERRCPHSGQPARPILRVHFPPTLAGMNVTRR